MSKKIIRRLITITALLLMIPAVGAQPSAIDNAWEMPPLILEDIKGEKHNLYDWHGKVILLNFWASWCGPCLAEIPHLIEFQNKYAARGLQVIGLGLDEINPARNVIRTLGISYPVLIAPPNQHPRLLTQWGNEQQVLPYTALIDRDGHIRFSQIGIIDEESFVDNILPLLDSRSLVQDVNQ